MGRRVTRRRTLTVRVRKTLTTRPREKREKKRRTVRARKRTRRMPNKNPLNQKPLAKLSRIHLQNSPKKTHLTTHIIGMSYSSYIPHISLSPLTTAPDTSRTIFPPSLSNACRSNDAAHLKTKLFVVCRFDGTW